MLNLNDLSLGMPALTPSTGQSFAEAGAVCLESQKHSQGVMLNVGGFLKTKHALYWPVVTDQMLRTHNDKEVATENGSYGIAFLLLRDSLGLEVIRRSYKGTGFDYYLGEKNIFPFQSKARLEVSGIRKGNIKIVADRVNIKLKQTNRSDYMLLPAYIVVVEFSQPLAEVRKK